jgi:hypothetical protein
LSGVRKIELRRLSFSALRHAADLESKLRGTGSVLLVRCTTAAVFRRCLDFSLPSGGWLTIGAFPFQIGGGIIEVDSTPLQGSVPVVGEALELAVDFARSSAHDCKILPLTNQFALCSDSGLSFEAIISVLMPVNDPEIEVVRNQLNMFSRFFDPLASVDQDDVDHDDNVNSTQFCSALIGLGPGLTPLGDDVILGVLASWTALNRPGIDLLRNELKPLMIRTTNVSSRMLNYGINGIFPEGLCLMARGIAMGETLNLDGTIDYSTLKSGGSQIFCHSKHNVGNPSFLEMGIRLCSRFGHTSGQGMIAGFLLGTLGNL